MKPAAFPRTNDARALLPRHGGSDVQGVIDALPIGVLIAQQCERDALICRASNAIFEGWIASGRFGAIGRPLASFAILDSDALHAAARDTLGDGRSREVEWSIPGTPYDRSFTARMSLLPDAPLRLLVAIRDRSHEIEAERNLRRTMLHDALTGLPNRVLFTERVEAAIERLAKDSEPHAAVLTLNVDRFKAVNESLGHVAGDELLSAFACRLLTCLRAKDVLARLSGDEFAILAHDLTAGAESAITLAGRVLAELNKPFQMSGQELFVNASIGIATTLTSRPHAEELLRDSDFAMHRAKRGGAGRVEVYQPLAHHLARDRFRLEGDLRRAVERNQLRLFYQPLVDLESGQVAGFEALARWFHPERGLIGPADFIPLAEECGAIVPIGRWALEAACRQLAAWRAAHGERAARLVMGVNLSGLQFARDDVVDAVTRALAASGLPADRLKLELTESVVIDNPERTAAVLDRLKEIGVSIALDEFGTGYSSLSYLQRLPIDMLKIDRSFVAGMTVSRDSYKIVTAILSLAGSLGLRVVAEGIEQPDQAETLAALGCGLGQGFHFARPLPADQAGAYLDAFSAA